MPRAPRIWTGHHLTENLFTIGDDESHRHTSRRPEGALLPSCASPKYRASFRQRGKPEAALVRPLRHHFHLMRGGLSTLAQHALPRWPHTAHLRCSHRVCEYVKTRASDSLRCHGTLKPINRKRAPQTSVRVKSTPPRTSCFQNVHSADRR